MDPTSFGPLQQHPVFTVSDFFDQEMPDVFLTANSTATPLVDGTGECALQSSLSIHTHHKLQFMHHGAASSHRSVLDPRRHTRSGQAVVGIRMHSS